MTKVDLLNGQEHMQYSSMKTILNFITMTNITLQYEDYKHAKFYII